MLEAPSAVATEQLAELGLMLKPVAPTPGKS
jgi:hypothetical protein